MPTLSLSCPLCCNETFSTHISLKYHLLSMIDNLLCPACNVRCENLIDLTEHLGRECKNPEPKTFESVFVTENHSEPSSSQDSPKQTEMKSDSKEDSSTEIPTDETQSTSVKKEVEETSELEKNEIDNQIAYTSADVDEQAGNTNDQAQADSYDQANETDTVLDNNAEGEHMQYTCQMCNISFSSVQEHLSKYHEGEEVLLETDEQDDIEGELQYEDETESFLVFNDDKASDHHEETENGIDNVENASERAHPGSGVTVSEEDVLDKGGNVYTRKIVKVGTEWMNQPQNKETEVDSGEIEPVTTKYIVENGKVRKLTDEDDLDSINKSSLIEVHCCPKCNLQFPNMLHFKKHKCNIAKTVTTTTNFKKRLLKEVKEELKYQCTFCQAIYSSLIGLNDHMKSHLESDESGMVQKRTITMTLHNCNICNTKFPTFKQLRLHSKMHEPIKSKEVEPPVSYNIMGVNKTENEDVEREMFQCPICDKTYDKEYEEVHMRSHEGLDNVTCVVCNREFDTRENLEMHMKAHSSTKKFACSYCKKPFTNYPALEEHVLKQCQKRQYACQYCGRRFSRPHEKVKHERIHTGEKPHICQVCGKAFRVSYCLTLHMRTHSGTRPYSCEHCGKRFKSHGVYNHHMATHSEERKYKCPFCPKAFKTAVQLAGHKNSHTKPFSCTECNRPFASLYAVRAHMETHKRENNLKFHCWLCGASYARSFAFRDHMNTVHGDKIASNEHDQQLFMDMVNETDESQLENQENDSIEHEDFQDNPSELCQIISNEGEEEEGVEYVVLHEAEVQEHNEETPMEVVEA